VRAVTRGTASQLIHTARVPLFWERDHKGGYLRDRPKPPRTELIRDGLKELKGEIKLWKDEVKEHFEGDPILIYRRGECRLLMGQR
jgi:NADH dehydrogenase [ubiquinone] 1 alpha subcomplex assembly factor 1